MFELPLVERGGLNHARMTPLDSLRFARTVRFRMNAGLFAAEKVE
jgi:hypothetical protein